MSTSNAPASSPSSPQTQTTLPTAPLNIDEVRQTLRSGKLLYLADASTLEKVLWSPNGSSHVLCYKSETPGQRPEEALLTIAGKISSSAFYLSPDGGWSNQNDRFNNALSSAKSTCLLVKPDDAGELTDDFLTSLANLIELENVGATYKDNILSAIKNEPATNSVGLRLTWTHFEKANTDSSSEEEEKTDSSNSSASEKGTIKTPAQGQHIAEFELSNWAGISDKTARAYAAISDEFIYRPICAYSKAGHLLKLHEYSDRLKDAVVEVQLALIHWPIASSSRSSFTAEIREINVVVRPKPAVSSPMKRKNPMSGPSKGKPKKKGRVGR